MIIKRMKATFGNLAGSELELKNGLNIVTAPNESGKSTWMAFIRAMFYGIDTAQRDKGGVLADKNRYRPWNGAAMSGEIEVDAEGKSLVISRDTASVTSPMRKFSAVYSDTGDEVKNISSESAGLRLLGMEQSVFRRTCFIGQREMNVNHALELEKRIENIVTTGDEGASYTQADERLRGWERSINNARSGELNKINAAISEIESRMARQQEMNRISGELRSRMRRLAETKSQLERDIQLARQLDTAEDVRRRFNAFNARNAALEEKRSADARFDEYQRIPLRSELEESNRLLDKADRLKENLEAEKKRKHVLENRVKVTTEAVKNATVWDEQDAEKVIKQGEEKLKRETELGKKKRRCAIKMSIGLFLVSLCVVFLMVGNIENYTVLSMVGLVGTVAGALMLVVNAVERKEAEKEQLELLTADVWIDIEDVVKKSKDYKERLKEQATAVERLAAQVAKLKEFEKEIAAAIEKANEPVKNALGDRFCEDDIRLEISKMLEDIERQSAAGAKLKEAESVVAAVGEYCGEEAVNPELIEKPSVERVQAEKELAETRSQLENCAKELGMRDGAVLEIGDPAEMAAQLRELTGRKMELEMRLDAIQGAIEVLKDADRKVRERFSPLLNKRASEIMGELTNGRYKTIMLDKEFNARAVSENDTVARSMSFFSSGTLDQMYLAVRLAMCDLVVDENKNVPIILDDAFAYFDDERMKAALDVIARYAKSRQVILFTCQAREGEYLRGRESVNIIDA